MEKMSSGIHPMYKCLKFQHDRTIFKFSREIQIFTAKRVLRRVQKWRFWKK